HSDHGHGYSVFHVLDGEPGLSLLICLELDSTLGGANRPPWLADQLSKTGYTNQHVGICMSMVFPRFRSRTVTAPNRQSFCGSWRNTVFHAGREVAGKRRNGPVRGNQ